MNKSIFVNKPTQEGLRALKVALVEFTGQTCYLRPEMWYGNFIENFWYARNEVKSANLCLYVTGKSFHVFIIDLFFNVNKTMNYEKECKGI